MGIKIHEKHQQQYKQSGITLVALVVTIITLLILAGVTINLALGNNGIIEKATYASNTMANATKTETKQMEEVTKLIDEATINLPSEYQRVEYIESTGIQYINTKLIANDVKKIQLIFNISKLNGNHQGIIGGGWSQEDKTFQLILNNSTMQFGLRYGKNYINKEYDNDIHYIELSKHKILFDNIEQIEESSIDDDREVILFARQRDNLGSGIQQYSFSKIYECEIQLINDCNRKFIPCYSTVPTIDVNGK